MFGFASAIMPSAASEASSRCSVIDGPAVRLGRSHLAAQKVLGAEATQHDVRVGDGRFFSPLSIARRTRSAPALRGPTRKAPPAST